MSINYFQNTTLVGVGDTAFFLFHKMYYENVQHFLSGGRKVFTQLLKAVVNRLKLNSQADTVPTTLPIGRKERRVGDWAQLRKQTA